MKGFKTVTFNAIMGVISVGVALNPDMISDAPTAEEVQAAVNSAYAAIGGVTMVGNWIIRAFTSSPIFRKR